MRLLDLATEGKNLLHEFRGANPRLQHALKILIFAACLRQTVQDDLGIGDHGRKHIIEVVGYSAGQRADRFQFLTLPQPLFQLNFLGDVAGDQHITLNLTAFVLHGRDTAVQRHHHAVAPQMRETTVPRRAGAQNHDDVTVGGSFGLLQQRLHPQSVQFFGLVAEIFGGGLVNEADDQIPVKQKNRLGRLLHGRRQVGPFFG